MKLVIFGLSISSAWGNGHATLWRGICRGLAQDGHTVVFYELDAPYYAAHRDLTDWTDGELVLYTTWDDTRARAARDLADADVGMVTSYCPDGMAATELVLESDVPVRSFYDLDAPVTLDRLRRGEAVEYLTPRGLRDFDIVFSYTGGDTLRELQQRLGAARVVPIYGCVDPDVHRSVARRDDYSADLSYLGTYAADRQAALETLFIEPARELSEQRFLIGGAQYPPDFPWTSNIYFVRHVPPPDHPAFYSSSRLTLNVTRAAMAAAGWCPSGRLFEAAACGTPILSDHWPGLEEFFTPGREILLARNTEEAVEIMALDDAELKRVARAARERTLREHTALQRAREMVRQLDGARGAVAG